MTGYAKGRARRLEILDQALELFAEAGFRGASLRELARRCGLSHPGLLYHFATKEELLLAALARRDEVDGLRAGDAGEPGAATLRSAVDIAALNAGRRGVVELYVVLSAEATSPQHPAHAFFVERYARTLARLRLAYDRLEAEGRLLEGVRPADAAAQLVALMDGLQVQWLLDEEGVDMAAVLRAHVDRQLVTPL